MDRMTYHGILGTQIGHWNKCLRVMRTQDRLLVWNAVRSNKSVFNGPDGAVRDRLMAETTRSKEWME